MPDTVTGEMTLLILAEGLLWLLGAVLIVRLFSTPRVRSLAQTRRLPAWRVSFSSLIVCAVFVFLGAFWAQRVVASLDNDTLGEAATNGDLWKILLGVAFQGGMLLGAVVSAFYLRIERHFLTPAPAEPPPLPTPTPLPFGQTLLAGVGTFAIAVPVVVLVSALCNLLIDALGIPNANQEMVELFVRAGSPAQMIAMAILAALIAPLTEEALFRAGLFRYLRTRIPRVAALLLPAVIFAVLHVNWQTLEGLNSLVPLVVLAVIFSLAYERTGRIAVPMIAHALFNFHTLILLGSGITA